MGYCVLRRYTGDPNDLPVVSCIREIDGLRLSSLDH
jgi:hypothetical protein